MATFIIGTIVFALLFLAIFNMFKKSKNNYSGCGCGCTGCSSEKSCNNKIEFKYK